MEFDKYIEILKNKGVTAYEIHKKTGLNEAGVRRLLNGEVEKPRRKTKETIVNFVENLSSAIQTDISSIKVIKPLSYIKTKVGLHYEELKNGKYLLTVPLVPVKAQASYVSEYQDAEFVSELEKVNFIVDRLGQGNYRAFEVMNDSMDDDSKQSIPDGSIVLGRELQKHHWRDKLRTSHFNFWIIVHKNTVMCKEIVKNDVEKGTITCHSLNESPEYQDFTISLNDVKELYNIIKKQIDI